jgi:hypothetical protein
MKTINFEILYQRIKTLVKINSNISKENILKRFIEEKNKLIKDNEQFVLCYMNDSPHPTIDNLLFRARINIEGLNENKISSFSYPIEPPLNRCNIPKHPVFYCSDKPSVSIKEIIKSENPLTFPITIYLSTWKVKSKKEWKILPFIFDDLPLSNQLFNYTKNSIEEFNILFRNILPRNDIKKFVRYYHKIFRLKNYKFSSIISHDFLYEDKGDIIIYPTVQLKKEGNNYAFNTKWIDNETICLNEISKYRIHKDEEYYLLYLESKGKPKNKIINWEKCYSEDGKISI